MLLSLSWTSLEGKALWRRLGDASGAGALLVCTARRRLVCP